MGPDPAEPQEVKHAAQRTGARGVAQTAPVRCAIYARKSTSEGLDSNFSSIDNQREAAEAFICSQRHEGWSALADRYDDGGFSGGNVERPALKRLLADVDKGLIDTIVVYKLDRLSRSLVDFGRIHEFLEKCGVALVSVTESINTKSPHGRMMVNVLLSFAQYERELVGERTRDKLRAARRKGKFVGGGIVLGYDRDPAGGRLVVNQDEVPIVREVFRLFLETRSLVGVVAALNRRGVTLKRWTTRDGKVYGGGQFNVPNLRRMLTSHTYIGKVNFEGTVYDAEHDGIVPLKMFREVQRVLDENRSSGGSGARNGQGFLLRGLLRCNACDASMVPSWTRRRHRTYRYYTCRRAQKQGHAACPTKMVKADSVEAFVVNEIRRIGADPELQRETFRQAVQQLAAQRRGLAVERKRLQRDVVAAQVDVERLVATLSRTTGPAADAVRAELEKVQEQTGAIQARLGEVREQEATVAAQTVDEADVARALRDWVELWNVLLVPERERVLRLLVAAVRYDGASGKLEVDWCLAGFGELAHEVGGA